MKISAVFLLLFLIGKCPSAQAQAALVDDLPGWKGEINSGLQSTKITGSRMTRKSNGASFDPTKVIQLAWQPRLFLYPEFLSMEECDHLKNLAKSKLERSMVADDDSGESMLSDARTSSGMFIDKGQDDIIRRIEDRIAAWTFLPTENGEALQVLRYEHGEKYDPHFDFFNDKQSQVYGGQRFATVLMYLSNVSRGGETVFPNSPDPHFKDETWSDCAKKGFAVKPRKGDALLFFSLTPQAVPDMMSRHGSCPIFEGEKWSATKWIHVSSFDEPTLDMNICEDYNEQCAEWAAKGECEKNPAYMVGINRHAGNCRKSCGVCS